MMSNTNARTPTRCLVLAMVPLAFALMSGNRAALPEPTAAAVGAVVSTPEGEVLDEAAEVIGEATNNVAEYRAVLLGLERVRALGAHEVDVINDSELVARQLTGAYKVKHPSMRPLYEQATAALAGFDRWQIRTVPRDQNAHADRLVNEALDGLRREWNEAAINLGASSMQYWRWVALPVLWPSILGAVVPLFGNSFAACAPAPSLVGCELGIVPILIGRNVTGDFNSNPQMANALSLGMIVIISIIMTFYALLQRRSIRWLR